LVGIDPNAKRTIAVLDVVNRISSPSTVEEQAEALLQLTNIIRLFNVKERLGSGWGKYIYEVAINTLGEDAENKLRAKRKELLTQLASLDSRELEKIPVQIRKGLINQRIYDYEPPAREDFKRLFLNLVGTEDLKTVRISTHSPKPVTVLFSEGNATLLMLDNFYIDPATVRMFDSEKSATEFIARLTATLLYCKRKNLTSQADIIKDSIATEHSRILYKLWLKSLTEESDENIKIGERFKEYDILGAAEKIMANDAFYLTMKNIQSVALIEFAPSTLNFTSFVGTATFSFDDYGKDRISATLARDKQGSALHLLAATMLFDYLTKNFSLDDVYLERDFTIASVSKNDWVARLPLNILAECTADYDVVEGRLRALVGIKRFVLTFADGEFVQLTKSEESFAIDPIYHSIIYSIATMPYDEAGIMSGTFYIMPEFDSLLIELRRYGRVAEQAVNRANFVFSRGIRTKPFKYLEKDSIAGVVGSFTDVVTTSKEGKKK